MKSYKKMKTNKIKDEELTALQSKLSEMNDVKKRIGDIEIQKHAFQHHFVILEKEFQSLQDDLRKQYGDVSININDGSIKESGNETNT